MMARNSFITLLRRSAPAIAVIATGVLLSAIIFGIVRRLENENARVSFNRVAEEHLDRVQTKITLALTSLVSVGSFCDAEPSMDRSEFSRLTTPLVARNSAIQAMEWVPRVPAKSRHQFEEQNAHDGIKSFRFTERVSRKIITAGERDEYFPVSYVNPFQGNELALGFDLASDPVRREALERSRDSGELVASARITLVQETSDQYGFLVFRPVYRNGDQPTNVSARRQELIGFAVAVFRVSDIVGKTDYAPATSSLNLAIFDRDARPGEKLLFPKRAPLNDAADVPAGLVEVRKISVAGRTWELLDYPVGHGFSPERTSSWVSFVAGLCITFLLAAHLMERRRAEEALKASEERYRSLVYNIPDVVWTGAADGSFAFVSPNLARLSGFSMEEIEAHGARLFFSCIHPDDVEQVRQSFHALFVKGKPCDVEFRVRRKSGAWVWVRDRALVTYEKDGIVFTDGLLSDITARKRVEERLSIQYEIACALAECDTLDQAAPAVIQSLCGLLGCSYGVLWGVDRRAGILRWVNGWHEAALDLAELEAVQRKLTFTPYQGLAGSVWSSGEPTWIVDLSGLDGSARPADGSGLRSAITFPVISGGVVLSVMQLFSRESLERDEQLLQMLMAIGGRIGPLIERQRAEEALQQSEERAKLLFATIPHPAYVFDSETLDFLEANDAAVEQYGYSREDFLRMKASEILPPNDVERFKVHLQQHGLKKCPSVQWKHRRKDGQIIDVEIHHQPLDYDGRKARLAIAQDVTERNRLEIELRQAQKLEAVGGLAAGIAHEINTPIQFVGDNIRFLQDAFVDFTAVLGRYRELRHTAVNGGMLQEQIRGIIDTEAHVDLEYLLKEIPRAIGQSLDGVMRVSTIVRAMKEFAHPDQREKSAADINKALMSTLTVARNELKYVADVETEFADLPLVMCRISELNQVFLNLLINAAHAIADVVKESGQKGVITVKTFIEPNMIVISIADTGAGIPETIRNKIYEPFFTTKESGRGTGQGLAIARSVVVHHGGTLSFTSQVGTGTTFFIRLPLESAAQQQHDQHKETASNPLFQNRASTLLESESRLQS